MIQDFRELLDQYTDAELRLIDDYLERSRSILAHSAEEIRRAKRESRGD
jgi:hypothetical protein